MDYLWRVRGPDPSLSASLGSADAILVVFFLGGKVWLSRAYPNVMALESDRLSFLLLLLGECRPSPSGRGRGLEERFPGRGFPCLGGHLG